MSNFLIFSDFDYCSINIRQFWFCKQCYQLLKENKYFKFGSTNKLPWVNCKSYPIVLDCLFMIEKAVIICIYLVISIFKLRPNGGFNLIPYYRIKDHTVLLPHNTFFLLISLSFSWLALHSWICVVWYKRK